MTISALRTRTLSSQHSTRRARRLLRATVSLLALGLAPGLLLAQPQTSGSAFAERVTVRVAPLLGSPLVIASGPLPLASGASDESFADSRQVASLVVSTPATGKILDIGLLLASTRGEGTEVLSASSIEKTDLRLVGNASLVALQADAIESTAHLTGCEPGAAGGGSTHLVHARLRGPLGLWIDLPVDPAPNTVVLDLVGVRVVLNEQVASQSETVRSLAVNAVHVSVNGLVGLGLVSADIVLSQSQAQVGCALPPLSS